ncbi:MAG: YdcH family protein [Sphingomonas sp.]|jgi:hypothetical protein
MHSAHLSALEAKHALLDLRITTESRRPLPDNKALTEMKKLKLRIKEELAAF